MSKITVITPTWNQAEYIKDTMESVLKQTHRDIEYIVVDNCSEDGTKEIVESFCESDDRILYIREQDHGQAEAINKGLDRATGEIVCWLNSDDFFYDEKVLEKINERFQKEPDTDVLVGDGWYCDKGRNLTEYNTSNRKVKDWVLGRWYYIMQPSVFWRNTKLRLDEQYHYVFDWKFFVQMFQESKVVYTDEPYSVYRMYEDNKTGQDNAKRKMEIYLMQEELKLSSLNTAWCKHVYHVYEKAEKTGRSSMKKRVDFVSRILFHLTGKRICSF